MRVAYCLECQAALYCQPSGWSLHLSGSSTNEKCQPLPETFNVLWPGRGDFIDVHALKVCPFRESFFPPKKHRGSIPVGRHEQAVGPCGGAIGYVQNDAHDMASRRRSILVMMTPLITTTTDWMTR